MDPLLFSGMSPRQRARRRLLRRLRRAGVLCSVALIAWSVLLFTGIQVHGDSAHELINGSQTTQSLLGPLILFLLGICGLAVSIG